MVWIADIDILVCVNTFFQSYTDLQISIQYLTYSFSNFVHTHHVSENQFNIHKMGSKNGKSGWKCSVTSIGHAYLQAQCYLTLISFAYS